MINIVSFWYKEYDKFIEKQNDQIEQKIKAADVFTDDSILNRLEKIQVDPVLSKYEKALFAQQVNFFVS